MRKYVLLSAAILAGCHSYEIKAPDNFEGEALVVSGKQSKLRVGDFQLSNVERSWTKGSGLEIVGVKSQKRRQKYGFQVAQAGSKSTEVKCEFSTRERTVGLKGGWELMAGEGAGLVCDVAHGTRSSALEVSTESDAVLSGTYKSSRSYRVAGIGLTGLSGGKKGPAAGFHFYDGENAVALVQIISPRRVMFARSIDAAQRAELMPAIAALLLLDESIRDF